MQQQGRVFPAAVATSSPAATPSLKFQCFQIVGKQRLLVLEMRNRLLILDSALCFLIGAFLFFAPVFISNFIFPYEDGLISRAIQDLQSSWVNLISKITAVVAMFLHLIAIYPLRIIDGLERNHLSLSRLKDKLISFRCATAMQHIVHDGPFTHDAALKKAETKTKQTDGVHWHLLRCIGGQKIAGSFVMYRLKKSAAESLSTCYLIRILGLILTLLIFFHCSAVTPNLIYPEYLKIAKFWWFGWLVMNLILQTAHRWTIGSTLKKENIGGNILFQLDSLASLTIGAAWLAFPKWLLHRQVSVHLDESHEICARLMGAYFLTSYLISTHALHWQELYDRLIAVEARVAICITILIGQIWSQYAYSEHWNGAHWIGISLFSSWTVISVLYGFYLTKQFKQKQELVKSQ